MREKIERVWQSPFEKRMHFVREKRDKPPAATFMREKIERVWQPRFEKRMHFVREKRDKPPAGTFMRKRLCESDNHTRLRQTSTIKLEALRVEKSAVGFNPNNRFQ